MTRIAESEPGMWTSILMTNAEPIIERIEDFKDRLTYISKLLIEKRQNDIWEFFARGSQTRKEMEIISVVVLIHFSIYLSMSLTKRTLF
jgi:prephenate dehydrogenase